MDGMPENRNDISFSCILEVSISLNGAGESRMPSDSELTPYELTIEDRPGYLYVCVQADFIDLRIAVSYINELMSHLCATRCTNVLFVRETPAMVSKAHYAIICSVIINMLPADVTFAMVDRSPAHLIVREQILLEAKQKNRNIRPFDSFDEAEEWLLNALGGGRSSI